MLEFGGDRSSCGGGGVDGDAFRFTASEAEGEA